MSGTITTRTPWQLARLAECSDPDSDSSAGASFLLSIQSDVVDRINDDDWNEDAAHEIADGSVPVYTYTMWQTFVDVAAFEEDPSELGSEERSMNARAGICLYMIARRLADALAAELAEEADNA